MEDKSLYELEESINNFNGEKADKAIEDFDNAFSEDDLNSLKEE